MKDCPLGIGTDIENGCLSALCEEARAPQEGFPMSALWSPDGTSIVVETRDQARVDVYEVPEGVLCSCKYFTDEKESKIEALTMAEQASKKKMKSVLGNKRVGAEAV